MSISADVLNTVSSFSLDNYTSVSEIDLDEMYRKNLQLLESMENTEASSNLSDQSSRLYHSSLNVYISSQDSLKQSDENFSNNRNSDDVGNLKKRNLEIINNSVSKKMASHLGKSTRFSSYETLYDGLKSRSKEGENDGTILSANKNTYSTSDHHNKANKKPSSDSDRTLKSLSSEDSFSSVSSVDSENDERKYPFSIQQEKSLFSSNYFENSKSIPKLRPTALQMRPTSCYVDTKYGQYLSNKYPSRPNMVIIKRQDLNERSNLIISKPLGNYPSKFLNNVVSMTNSNNIISNNFMNKSSSCLNNELRSPKGYRQHLSVNNGNSPSNNILNYPVPQNSPEQNLSLTRSIRNTSFPKLNKPVQIEYNNNKKSDQINHSKFCSIQLSKSQIFPNNNSTNSEKSNQNFIDLSFQSANNGKSNYVPPKDIQNVPISKINQIQRTKKS